MHAVGYVMTAVEDAAGCVIRQQNAVAGCCNTDEYSCSINCGDILD
jgi:hypothetical protein